VSIWDTLLLGVMLYLALAAWVRVWEEDRWRASFTAFELRLPVEVDAEQAGRWIVPSPG
jgi:hypothetical protein